MTVTSEALRAIPLFAQLRTGDLNRIAPLVQEQSFKAKTLIFAEATPYSGLHIIKKGRAKIIKTSQDKEQILAILGPGELLDPIPLFDSGAHSVTAKAMSETLVYRLKPESANAIVRDYPVALTVLLNTISARLRKLATLANDLAFKGVTARVCKALLEQASHEGERTPQGIRLGHSLTRQELASLVGTAREVAWRSIKKLERDGLIRIDEHEITIVDPERLAALT